MLERDRLVGRARRAAVLGRERAGRDVLLVEELEDALGPGHGALQERVALRQEADRLEELADVLGEGDEEREGDRVVADAAQAGEPEDARDAERADHLDARVEHGLVIDGALVGVPVADVDHVELRAHGLFAHEGLHDRDAVDLLVQERVEARGARAHVAVRLARALADVVDDRADDGQRQERDDRQAPVERDHHRDDADEGDDVPHGVERARREQLAHGVDVVGGARDEAPDRGAVVVAEAQALEEEEDRRAQVGHGARPGELHRVHLRERERLHDDEEDREGHAVLHEAMPVAHRPLVHHVAHEDRAHQVDEGDDDERAERRDEIAGVGPDERPEATQQARVVRLPDGALLVEPLEDLLGAGLRSLRGALDVRAAASCWRPRS